MTSPSFLAVSPSSERHYSHTNSFSVDGHMLAHPHHLHVLSQDCRMGCAPEGCINLPLDSSTHWAGPCSPAHAHENYLRFVQFLYCSGNRIKWIRIIISRQLLAMHCSELEPGLPPSKGDRLPSDSPTPKPPAHLRIWPLGTPNNCGCSRSAEGLKQLAQEQTLLKPCISMLTSPGGRISRSWDLTFWDDSTWHMLEIISGIAEWKAVLS